MVSEWALKRTEDLLVNAGLAEVYRQDVAQALDTAAEEVVRAAYNEEGLHGILEDAFVKRVLDKLGSEK